MMRSGQCCPDSVTCNILVEVLLKERQPPKAYSIFLEVVEQMRRQEQDEAYTKRQNCRLDGRSSTLTINRMLEALATCPNCEERAFSLFRDMLRPVPSQPPPYLPRPTPRSFLYVLKSMASCDEERFWRAGEMSAEIVDASFEDVLSDRFWKRSVVSDMERREAYAHFVYVACRVKRGGPAFAVFSQCLRGAEQRAGPSCRRAVKRAVGGLLVCCSEREEWEKAVAVGSWWFVGTVKK